MAKLLDEVRDAQERGAMHLDRYAFVQLHCKHRMLLRSISCVFTVPLPLSRYCSRVQQMATLLDEVRDAQERGVMHLDRNDLVQLHRKCRILHHAFLCCLYNALSLRSRTLH